MKDGEILELRKALLKHIRDRIVEKMRYDEYDMLRKLYHRLCGPSKAGSPGGTWHRWYGDDEGKMYADMTRWLEWRMKRFDEESPDRA